MVKYKEIKNNKMIDELIAAGNHALGVLGYTDHSKAHAAKVAETAGKILKELGYDDHLVELAKIAGYMHDIGNAINRTDHAHSGALLAFQILKDMDIDAKDIGIILGAIGNHDENTGCAVDPVSAAIILADKTDVRRNRVRNQDITSFDNHDRVNYAAIESKVTISKEKQTVVLDITLDETICSVLEYFEIFLNRMLMCRRAAEMLNVKFKFMTNGNKVY